MNVYGKGSVEPRGPRWRARVYVAGKAKYLGTYATEAEASEVLLAWLKIRNTSPVPVEGETLRSYGTKWLELRDTSPDHRDSRNDRSRWKHVESAPFFDWPLVSINRRAIREWLTNLTGSKRGKQRSPQTVRHCLNLLRSCLGAAVDDEILERNPAKDVEGPPRTLREKQQWTYLTPAEQAKLTNDSRIPETDRLLITIALATGVRQGEQWCLELSDVHADEAEPYLWIRWGAPGLPPKNGRERRVPLTGVALVAIRRWLELLPTYTKTNPLGLAFPTSRGKRRQMEKPPRHWHAHLKTVGLNVPAKRHDRKRVRWHDLRHSCATSLINGWWGRRWTLQETSELLGHSSTQTTERYAHLAPSSLAAAAAETVSVPPAPQPESRSSQHRPKPGFSNPEILNDSAARPAGFEPATRGLEGRDETREIAHEYRAPGRSWDDLRPMAHRYLQAIASRNRFAHRYGVELAEAVLLLMEVPASKKSKAG